MKNISVHFLRFYLPVVLWAMVIFTFSSYPTATTSTFFWQDFIIKKAAHVIEYAILSLLVFRALYNSGIGKHQALKYAVLFCILYGISDEFHQSFTPGREPNIRDVLFDTIGASATAYLLWKYLPKAPKALKALAKNYQVV